MLREHLSGLCYFENGGVRSGQSVVEKGILKIHFVVLFPRNVIWGYEVGVWRGN